MNLHFPFFLATYDDSLGLKGKGFRFEKGKIFWAEGKKVCSYAHDKTLGLGQVLGQIQYTDIIISCNQQSNIQTKHVQLCFVNTEEKKTFKRHSINELSIY